MAGRRLIIDASLYMQLAVDADLCKHLPPSFAVLGEEIKQAYLKALEYALGNTCSGCSTLNEILRPSMNAFGAKLSETPPEELTRFVDYIAQRRGSRPSMIVLRYLDAAGKLATFSI